MFSFVSQPVSSPLKRGGISFSFYRKLVLVLSSDQLLLIMLLPCSCHTYKVLGSCASTWLLSLFCRIRVCGSRFRSPLYSCGQWSGALLCRERCALNRYHRFPLIVWVRSFLASFPKNALFGGKSQADQAEEKVSGFDLLSHWSVVLFFAPSSL